MSIPVSVSELQQFCNFLSTSLPATNYTWAFLDAHSKGVVKGLGTYVGSVDELMKKYHEQALNLYLSTDESQRSALPTVHITLNQTNDSGRKNSDIIACRVFCVDLDYVLDRSVLDAWVKDYAIEMVVESSPGKYHLYWQCDPSIRFEDWVQVQTALAGYFEGDLNLRSLCKTIRVPGFQRITKSGETFVPHLVYLRVDFDLAGNVANPKVRPAFLTDELMKESLELASQRMAADKKLQKKLSKEVKKRLAAPNTEGTQRSALDTPGIGRNTTLYNLVKEHVLTLDPDTTYSVGEDKALAYGYQVNAEFSEPLEASEVEQTVRSAYAAALSVIERRAAGIEEAKSKIAGCLAEPITQDLGDFTIDYGVKGMENGVLVNGHYPDSLEYSTPFDPTSGLAITDAVSQQLEAFNYNLKHKAIASDEFSDYAIAERVLQRYHTFILNCDDSIMAFSPLTKLWKVQTHTDCAEIKYFCKEVIIETVNNPDIVYACLTKDGEVSEEKLRRFKSRMLSGALLKQITGLVSGDLHHPHIPKAAFDAAPDMFYCANGVLNLLTGEVRDALPTDYLLARSQVEYIAGAECPGWEQFLLEVFENNDDPALMVRLLQEVFGYSLGGSILEQKVFIHLGGGSNGKSKILTALTRLTGEYATYMPPDELTKGKSFGKAFEEFGAKLEGMRVGIIDDLDSEGVWNEAFIKNITSPRIRARGKYEKSREFANRAKVHLGLNNAPKASAESHGLLRRLFIIPYNRRFEPVVAVSAAIDRMIESELSGILNWAIAGYRRWAATGLSVSAEVNAAVEDYKQENFHQETLIRELLQPLSLSEITETSGEFVHDIYDRYVTECSLKGQKATFTQIKLIKYISEMYSLKAKRVWCAAKSNGANKLQIKFKV